MESNSSTGTNATGNKYEAAGNLERQRLESFYASQGITAYTHTEASSFATVDSFFEKDGREFVVEAKVRNNNLNTYPDHLLQFDKYEQLRAYYQQGYKPLYINFFHDGLIVYNLATRLEAEGQNDLTFADKKCRVNTVNAGREVMRPAAYIRADEARWKDRVYHSFPLAPGVND